MPVVTFILSDGTSREVTMDHGSNLMRGAVASDVPGIVAECGGAAMCATCHVYVATESLALLPPIGEIEDAMLDCAAEGRTQASRLSCQLTVPELDLTVRVPVRQY